MAHFATPTRRVEIVTCQDKLDQVCEQLACVDRIGLDVETTVYRSPVKLCTIQIATTTQNWVIDVLAIDHLQPVEKLLRSRDVLKIIHNAAFECRVFAGYGIGITNIFDTLTASRRRRGQQAEGHSLGVVCQRELGFAIDKSFQRCDWAKRPLTSNHISYAALDAEVLIDLYGKLA